MEGYELVHFPQKLKEVETMAEQEMRDRYDAYLKRKREYNREWRKRNLEKSREYSRRYYRKLKEGKDNG